MRISVSSRRCLRESDIGRAAIFVSDVRGELARRKIVIERPETIDAVDRRWKRLLFRRRFSCLAVLFGKLRRRYACAKNQSAIRVAKLNTHARSVPKPLRPRCDIRPSVRGRAGAVDGLVAVQPLVRSYDLHVQSWHSIILPCSRLQATQLASCSDVVRVLPFSCRESDCAKTIREDCHS